MSRAADRRSRGPSRRRFWILAALSIGLSFAYGYWHARRARQLPPLDAAGLIQPPLPSLAQAALQEEEPWRRFRFPVGEKMVYSAYYGFIYLGEVTIAIAEKRLCRSRPRRAGLSRSEIPITTLYEFTNTVSMARSAANPREARPSTQSGRRPAEHAARQRSNCFAIVCNCMLDVPS